MEISFKNTKWKPIVHNEFKKKKKNKLSAYDFAMQFPCLKMFPER